MSDMLIGDCRELLPALEPESVHCVVTSPPYWGLRDYGVESQIGLEETPEQYVETMVGVFREVRRVLREDGTLWVNLGDGYTSGDRKVWRSGASQNKGQQVLDDAGHRPPTPRGLKPKDLVGIPWRVAFALQADGWYLRSEIIWHKPNPMPESVTDRPTKAHEQIFLLSKSPRYYYDAEAIAEPAHRERFGNWKRGLGSPCPDRNDNDRQDMTPAGSRNKRSVWTVGTQPYPGAHFATFPPALIRPCILAGCPEGGTVLDPFAGSGTTCEVSLKEGREFIGIELNPEYKPLIEKRLRQPMLWK